MTNKPKSNSGTPKSKASLKRRERVITDVFGPRPIGTPKEEAKKSVSRVIKKSRSKQTRSKE